MRYILNIYKFYTLKTIVVGFSISLRNEGLNSLLTLPCILVTLSTYKNFKMTKLHHGRIFYLNKKHTISHFSTSNFSLPLFSSLSKVLQRVKILSKLEENYPTLLHYLLSHRQVMLSFVCYCLTIIPSSCTYIFVCNTCELNLGIFTWTQFGYIYVNSVCVSTKLVL